ncbi:MAG: sulfatase [Armatimonadota bacterium]
MNVLFIDIDTLRADHLGCYGYHHNTSPNIHRLAEEGCLVEQMLCPGIPTHPGHATMYTGMHPIAHGIVSHGGERDLDGDAPWLPALLQQAGFTTCAVDNLLDEKPWFARGYEFYINPASRRRLGLLVTAEEVNKRAIEWLRSHCREPFFLFVHYWDPHTPYVPPKRLRDMFYAGKDPTDPANHSLDALDHQPLGRFWRENWLEKIMPGLTDIDYVRALYDAEVRYVDEAVGGLLDALDSCGCAEDTMVVLTSDHGESLTEHDILFDHHGLYQPTVRVPFVCRWPAGGVSGGRRLDFAADHRDITATILSAADAEVPDAVEGRNLIPVLAGCRGTSEYAGAPSIYEPLVLEECTWQAKWALVADGYKLIVPRGPDVRGAVSVELYHLPSDPKETSNVAHERPEVALGMVERLESWIAERIRRHNLPGDPLVTQGITLGKRYRLQEVGDAVLR